MDEILKDDRFKHIATDPKFKKVPKGQRKVKIDKRFQSIFSDKRFQVKYTVDKRGRPVNQSSSENFRKYYDLSSSDNDDDDDDDSESAHSDEDTNRADVTLNKISKQDALSKTKKNDKKTVKEKGIAGSVNDGNNVDVTNFVRLKKNPREVEERDSGRESESGDDDKGEKKEQYQLTSQLDSVKKRSTLPEEIREKLHDLSVDYARGIGTLMTDSSSDEASDEDFDESEEEVEHNWGELDRDAETTEAATHRLAICNMDWDRIRAVDLMVLCSSFLPSGGHIKSITIYPSEFGLKRMKEEDLKGPIELVSEKGSIEVDNNDDEVEEENNSDEESKEGSKYHMERLRQYQLNRLKYYYAVVECDCAETASKLYSECDGIEYESSATKLDLRFIPDDVTFDEKPKEVCTEVQDMRKYEPRFFVNTALQQGKVSCTWDETDPARTQLAEKLFQTKEIANSLDEDLQIFLSSSDDDDDDATCDNDKVKLDGDDNNDENGSENHYHDRFHLMKAMNLDGNDNKDHTSKQSIEKYRSLLNKLQEAEEKKKNRDVEMEITWGCGLKEKAQALVKKKLKENSELTPFERLIEKKKEKRKLKREEKINKKKGGKEDGCDNDDDNVPFSDDDLPDDIDLNDDYFKEEFGDKDNKKNKNKNKGNADELNDEEKQKKAELELLLADEVNEDHRRHFSLQKIQESEETTSKKKKKRRKQIIKNNKHLPQASKMTEDDDFQVDVSDGRFGALFSSHHFNIDPADSHFRKTKGMEAFIKEKINRKYNDSSEQDVNVNENPVPSKVRKLDSDFSKVVSSIKKKTKGLK